TATGGADAASSEGLSSLPSACNHGLCANGRRRGIAELLEIADVAEHSHDLPLDRRTWHTIAKPQFGADLASRVQSVHPRGAGARPRTTNINQRSSHVG